MQERHDIRSELFKAAADYHAAAAEYFRALRRGMDIETPTQEFFGKSVYYLALTQARRRRESNHRASHADVAALSRVYAAQLQPVRENTPLGTPARGSRASLGLVVLFPAKLRP